MDDRIQTETKENSFNKSAIVYPAVAAVAIVALIMRPDQFIPIIFLFALGIAILFLALRTTAVSQAVKPRNLNVDPSADIHHRFIDALQFPVFLLNAEARVNYLNQKAATDFGAIRLGDRITVRFRQPSLKETIEKAIAQNRSNTTIYNEPVPDDRWYSVEISPLVRPVANSTKDNPLFVLAFHDQTEARRIDQMRSDFIANASHELRTPLASLLGYIETIRGSAKNDEAARDRFTQVMLDQAERMTRLVNDLLSLSRIEMKAHVKPDDTVDLAEILKTVTKSLGGLSDQMGVKIKLELDKPAFVIGDRDELIQVFENLVENACKYGQDGKQVIVKLTKKASDSNDQAIVSVRDFGPGIAIEHQQRITERFYRVDVARSREKQGTGLGLAIVKHILNRHGTRLNVESQPGDGAEFSIRFGLVENIG
ncbi:MAG: ATP-binding protein [Pseudomonadota bacterium]